jgi:hypothetical protein
MIDPDKKISILDNYLRSIKFECEHLEGIAEEYIPQYYCINMAVDDNMVRLASSYNYIICNGVSVTEVSNGELIKYIRFGVINFDTDVFIDVPPLTPLFMGPSGELTIVVPTRSILQKVGYTMSNDSAFIDIQEPIFI